MKLNSVLQNKLKQSSALQNKMSQKKLLFKCFSKYINCHRISKKRQQFEKTPIIKNCEKACSKQKN